MNKERRCAKRYMDFARVDIPALCVFPGVLKDISFSGCRVRFSANLDINIETECEILIYQSRKKNIPPLHLLGIPMWAQKYTDATDVGIRFLHSRDMKILTEYIALLEETMDALND